MADFTKGRQTFTQGVEVGAVHVGGEEVEFLFGQGTQLFPNLPVPIYGACGTRMVLDAGQKWFEVGFRMDHLLSGNAAAGWTDAGNYFRIEPQWSIDLVNWSMGKFLPAPVPVINLGGGVYEYWSRCIHPQDSAIKSGQLEISSGAAYGQPGTLGNIGSDSRNNPFTALTILGVSRALGGFPYTMPGDAARMQTDLSALFPGATVEASADTVWRIRIPAITFGSFGQLNKIFWPVYLVANSFGAIVSPVDGSNLDGNFVNAEGLAIYNKAFARLKITAGTRYDPYH